MHQTESQRANLQPFRPGYDPRRQLNGRKPGHRAKIRAYLATETSQEIESTEGQKAVVTLTEADWIVLKAVELAKAGDRHSRAWLYDRGYGKPVQPIAMSGSLSVESPEEQRAALETKKQERLEIARQRLLAKGVKVEDAEFRDVSETKSGEIDSGNAICTP